eukprot:COSAG05_NODE_5323_length_1207_cov_1.425993_2_plen_262_part_01
MTENESPIQSLRLSPKTREQQAYDIGHAPARRRCGSLASASGQLIARCGWRPCLPIRRPTRWWCRGKLSCCRSTTSSTSPAKPRPAVSFSLFKNSIGAPQLSSESVALPVGTVKLGKMACSVAELLGVAWGSRLQVVGRNGTGHLVPLDEDVLKSGLGDTSPETGVLSVSQRPSSYKMLANNQHVKSGLRVRFLCWSIANWRALTLRAASGANNNNSKLVDDNTAQQLRHEEIEKMKLDGRGGRAIVDAVVKNSATYADKTD